MNTTTLTPDEATITVSLTELHTLNNALNEVCNGLHIEEFATRMGVEREEAAALLEQIHALIGRMR
ncbi:MAG TPA: hypothetical protein VFT45_17715 [Longimicrobium sp.]|nr:hypothetical protein [Longimicrobium sp.]